MDSKQGSKSKFILPIVLGLILILTSFGWLHHLFAKQVAHYKSDAAATAKIWIKEGMKPEAFDAAVRLFTKVKLKMSAWLTSYSFIFIIAMAIAIATDSWVVGGKNANNMLEIACLLFFNAYGGLSIYYYAVTSDIVCALVIASVLGPFYWFTRNKLSWKEQLYCACLLSSPLFLMSIVFFSDYSFAIDLDDIPIQQYTKMDAGLKERIIKAGGENGIAPENIFIVKSEDINAAATRGMRFRYIFVHDSCFEAFSADQLMAVIYHEIGHVVHNHIITSIGISLVYSFVMIAAVMFAYRKITTHYNGFSAWILTQVLLFASFQLFIYVYNLNVKQRNEYEADLSAYSRPEYWQALIDVQRILALSHGGGKLFDYEDCTARFLTHPSSYKRILAARDYRKNK